MKKVNRLNKSSIIVYAFAASGGGAGPPPGGPGGNDRGGHGDPSGGGRWYYYWIPMKLRARAARSLVRLAERLNPQVLAQPLASLPEVTMVQRNWRNRLYGFLQGIPGEKYLAYSVGAASAYGGGRFSSIFSNEKTLNQSRPHVTSFNKGLLDLSDRLRSATTSTSPTELQRLLDAILTTNLARTGAEELVYEYDNPNWFVFLWQQLLSVPYRRGGPSSPMPRVAQIDRQAAEHFFALIFPLYTQVSIGDPGNPDWQAASERLSRIVAPQFTTSEVATILNRTTVDRQLLNAILGLLFLLIPSGKNWVLVLPYSEEAVKFLSSILRRYGAMLFLFTRSVCCYGVVLSVLSLLSYMIGLSFLSVLRLFIEDEKLESHLEGFKSVIIGFIMLFTEIPLWILAFTFVFFRTFLNKRKERVKKSFLNIRDQFSFFLTDNLNKLEEKGRADYEAEMSFCL